MAAKGQRKCSECKQYRGDVRVMLDPFASEVHGDVVKRPLCCDCYDAIALEA
jgi:hypothetical protein